MRTLNIVLILVFLTACGKLPPMKQEAFVFGTRVEVLVWGAPDVRAQTALGEVLREFDRLHRAYHAWQDSELTELNAAIAAGRPHEVSEELAALIRDAQEIAARGEHLFDPGIGRLVALWGFHSDEFKPARPDAAALAALVAAKPSIAALRLDDRRVTSADIAGPPSSQNQLAAPHGGAVVSLGRPGADASIALDFGGYLKGVALDRAAIILKTRNIDNALINIGGNVLALGSKGDTPWRVGIQHPRAEQHGGAPLATLELRHGEAIGTSGDYQRFFELDGRRYSHLIDPRTGEPATGTQSLTVLIPPGADAGMRSDVLSKPLFVAGDAWPALAEKLGVTHALRVDEAGRIEVTAAFAQRLEFVAEHADIRVLP